jgi:hypothetical protein
MTTFDGVPVVQTRPYLPPPGTSFELGWVMAQLFDQRRFQPPGTRAFNPSLQLPMISDLDHTVRRRIAVAQLHELISPNFGLSDAGVQASAVADPFHAVDFEHEVRSFHLALLEKQVDNPPVLSAYNLGIALSDLCWIHTPDGDWPDAFLKSFARGEVAELQVLLRGATYVLPELAAATVSKSLEKWQDWADVTAPVLERRGAAQHMAVPILRALRDQGNIWHALLTTEPLSEDDADPRLTTFAVLRRLRPILIVAALTAVVLYVTIADFSGAAKVWTTIATITAALGVTGVNLISAARKAVNAFGWNEQTTAKAEARVWSVTMLPTIPLTARQRYKLDRRGVHLSLIRANLDARSF